MAVSATWLASTAFALSLAQQDGSSTVDDETIVSPEDTIVVQAQRPRGEILGDVEPDLVLDQQDVASYGVSTLGELLQALEAETGSSRGRGGGGPIVLLNGRRVSGFRDIFRYPFEAIDRVEILPEETALSYGFPADARVINFVLKSDFRAVTAEGEIEGATAGGRYEFEEEGVWLRIDGDNRLSLDVEFEQATALFEDERDVERELPTPPFDVIGNVTAPVIGSEIDPVLSTLAGEILTTAPVPGTAREAFPPLTAFSDGTGPNITDDAAFRTLSPEQSSVSVGASLARPFGETGDMTYSAAYEQSTDQSVQGLPTLSLSLPADLPASPFSADVVLHRYAGELGLLARETDRQQGEIGFAANRYLKGWNGNATARLIYNETEVRNRRSVDASSREARIAALDPTVNPFALLGADASLRDDLSESRTLTGQAEVTASGPLREVPAGELRASFKVGAQTRQLSSEDTTAGVFREQDLDRDELNVQGSLDMPLFDDGDDRHEAIGRLAVNLNAAVDELSDFGTLTTLGGGITWRPVEPLQIIASVTSEDGAPSISDLGDPVIETENVRVFDFTTGETVFVTRRTGGNPELSADSRRVIKFGANWQPLEETNLVVRSDFTDTVIDAPQGQLGSVTPAIQDAFPDRFVRDQSGQLSLVDATPLNFDQSTRRTLRSGLTWSKRLGNSERGGPPAGGRGPGSGGRSNRPASADGQPGQGGSSQAAGGRPQSGNAARNGQSGNRDAPTAPGDGERGGNTGNGQQGQPQQQRSGAGGRGGGSPFGGRRPGRFRISAFHTYRLEDTLTLAPGLEPIDFLDGGTLGDGGGRPRHTVEVDINYFNNGVGMFTDISFQSGTTADATNPEDRLTFSSLTTVDTTLFFDFNQRREMIAKRPWLKGMRVRLSIDNVFDVRQEVENGRGETPLNFQQDLINPVGRTLEVSLRKVF